MGLILGIVFGLATIAGIGWFVFVKATKGGTEQNEKEGIFKR